MNLASLYEQTTLALSEHTGASDGVLHIHAGMTILLVARLILGRTLASGMPFLVVCVLALANEALDRINHGQWDWPDTSGDVAVTLFWPLVLTLGARMMHARKANRRRPKS